MRAPCLVHSCVLTGRRGRELSGASLQGAFLFLGLHLRGLITSQRPCMTWGIRTSTYTFWGDVEIQTIAVAMCVTIQGGFVIKLTQELRKVNQPFLDTCYSITRKKNPISDPPPFPSTTLGQIFHLHFSAISWPGP